MIFAIIAMLEDVGSQLFTIYIMMLALLCKLLSHSSVEFSIMNYHTLNQNIVQVTQAILSYFTCGFSWPVWTVTGVY